MRTEIFVAMRCCNISIGLGDIAIGGEMTYLLRGSVCTMSNRCLCSGVRLDVDAVDRQTFVQRETGIETLLGGRA